MFRSTGRAEDLALPGLEDAFEDLAALAGLRVCDAHAWDGVAELGVEVCVGVRELEGRLGYKAHPPPLEVRTKLEDLGHALEGRKVAFPGDDPAVLVFDLAASLLELAHEHEDGLQEVEWLEAGDHARLAVVLGHELVWPAADDGRDVPGPDKRVQAQIRRVEQRPHRRDDRYVVAEHGEVLDALLLRPLQGQRRRWGRGLEADGDEDNLAFGILARNAQGIEWRVDHADIRAFGLYLEQVSFRARDAHHVPKAGEDDFGTLGDGYPVVYASHWEDADRAARPVYKLYLIR